MSGAVWFRIFEAWFALLTVLVAWLAYVDYTHQRRRRLAESQVARNLAHLRDYRDQR